MNEVEALRKALSMTSLMRIRYERSGMNLPICPARDLFAEQIYECDQTIRILRGMIEVRAPTLTE